jgi:hypothetical protein
MDPSLELAHDLRRRGLAAPARLLLDAHAPIRPLLAHALTVLSPAVRPLLGARLEAVEAALTDDQRWARLLEALADEGPA